MILNSLRLLVRSSSKFGIIATLYLIETEQSDNMVNVNGRQMAAELELSSDW